MTRRTFVLGLFWLLVSRVPSLGGAGLAIEMVTDKARIQMLRAISFDVDIFVLKSTKYQMVCKSECLYSRELE